MRIPHQSKKHATTKSHSSSPIRLQRGLYFYRKKPFQTIWVGEQLFDPPSKPPVYHCVPPRWLLGGFFPLRRSRKLSPEIWNFPWYKFLRNWKALKKTKGRQSCVRCQSSLLFWSLYRKVQKKRGEGRGIHLLDREVFQKAVSSCASAFALGRDSQEYSTIRAGGRHLALGIPPKH